MEMKLERKRDRLTRVLEAKEAEMAEKRRTWNDTSPKLMKPFQTVAGIRQSLSGSRLRECPLNEIPLQ